MARLNDALKACAERNEAVIQLSKNYAAEPQSTAWKGKARELIQKLRFPFEKKALLELTEIMIAFRGNVDTALALLEL